MFAYLEGSELIFDGSSLYYAISCTLCVGIKSVGLSNKGSSYEALRYVYHVCFSFFMVLYLCVIIVILRLDPAALNHFSSLLSPTHPTESWPHPYP